MPPPLQQFAAEFQGLDYDESPNEIFLYHGTNCYRRWEINRTGFIEPGRNQYSFFSTSVGEAYTYARAACMRDIGPHSFNSLICEPVVLKVRFNTRTWLQVDFLNTVSSEDTPIPVFTAAVLGPVTCTNIVDVLHCTHGRRLGGGEPIRTFQDGTFIESIRHLKDKLAGNRLDAWLLKKLGLMRQTVEVRLAGGEVPELTSNDHLRKLRQSQVRA